MTSEAYIGIFVFSLVFPYTICHTAKRKDIPLYAQGFFATSHNLWPPELPFWVTSLSSSLPTTISTSLSTSLSTPYDDLLSADGLPVPRSSSCPPPITTLLTDRPAELDKRWAVKGNHSLALACTTFRPAVSTKRSKSVGGIADTGWGECKCIAMYCALLQAGGCKALQGIARGGSRDISNAPWVVQTVQTNTPTNLDSRIGKISTNFVRSRSQNLDYSNT